MQAYSDRYDAALVLAARAHRTQTRKGTDIPYVVHPVHVSTILIRYGYGEEVAIAGLLHDVVEDQEVPLSYIQAEFGPVVAGIVAALSERKREGEATRPWDRRKQEALDKLRETSEKAVAVKAADALHNARSLATRLRQAGASAWQSFARGPEDTLWYYHSVAGLVRDRLGSQALVEELEQAIQDLEQVAANTEDS